MLAKRHVHFATRLLSWLVLVAMLGMTWMLWDHERQSANRTLRAEFDFALRDTVSRIEQREAAYEQMLRGVQGLFSTTDITARNALRDYVDALELDANFSGIQGIGVVKWVPSSQKAAHIATMRHLGKPTYAISPAGEREAYAPIIQRVPEVGRNRAVLGIDSWAEPLRRQAMAKARDSGMPAITGKVRLVVDQASDAPSGFVMYLPVFARGRSVDSLAQRRANLIGWVSASFRMNDFMASLYGQQASGLSMEIFDGTDLSAATLMYHNDKSGHMSESGGEVALSVDEYMVVAGHPWTLRLSTKKEFESRFGRNVSVVIAATGVGLSVSMALLVWLMVSGRARALRLADEMTAELRHMAQHDPLTGLPNRALFSDRVQQELAHAKRNDLHVALIFIDLDNFKSINDNYGHQIGDRLLQQVGIRLRDAIRASDTAGRIGGDEFVVVMGEMTDAQTALKLAEKIRYLVAEPFMVQMNELSISCSIGVAVYPEDGVDEVSLTKSADKAMYRAKDNGRNGVQAANNCQLLVPA